MVEKKPTDAEKVEQKNRILPNRRAFMKYVGVTGALGTTVYAGQGAASETEPPEEDERPSVRLLSTGGTIASTEEAAEGSGYSLSEQADAIIEAVPELDEIVDIEVEEVAQKGSPSLLIEDYVATAEGAKKAQEDGMDGVIVTHGTDAIEENAYFNDLVLDLDIPVVFVGAMRPGDAVSADGPANLLTASRLILSEEFHLSDDPSGVYVAMNDTVHAARDVTKTNTTKVETFESGPAGEIAVFTDDELLIHREPGSYSSDLSDADLSVADNITVPIVTTGGGADAYVIQQAVYGSYDVDGIVLQNAGRGGVSPDISDASNKAIDDGIPVARASRVHYGPVAPNDEEGSTITMGDLPAWKARIHMIVSLTMTTDIEEIREMVEEGNYGDAVVPASEL